MDLNSSNTGLPYKCGFMVRESKEPLSIPRPVEAEQKRTNYPGDFVGEIIPGID